MGGSAKSNKRKKHHDKDKYYNLAKEQGLRSRAAFKLSQINRKFPFLQDARIVLDLCAAPGGWTQIAARTMPRTEQTHIVAVDILPIRPFPGFQGRITTLIGDITTEKCKADISKTLRQVSADTNQQHNGRPNKHRQQAACDLVLHDGAPNIGADYSKDAYMQNEIAVHALKCATQHLKARGHFVTKVYRSRDYAAYLWVCQQLFETVTAFKPKASRVQSAEIFLVCQDYKAPEKIDPRMLDPKYIFEQVEGAPVANADGTTGVHVFHKAWDQKKRNREGYDMTHLDATMRHIEPVATFIEAKGMKEAIQIMSTCTGLSFTCSKCSDTATPASTKENQKPQQPTGKENTCKCHFYLTHPLTTPDTKACVSDLKLLNKSDFKALLGWRAKMHDALQALKDMEEEEDDDDDDDDSDKEDAKSKTDDNGSDKEESQIQSEIEALRQKQLREKKRQKKKERALAAKRRQRAALGMDLNAIDVPEHEKIFSLATITSKGGLEVASEVNLDRVTDAEILPDENEDDIVVDLDESLNQKGAEDKDEETGYSYRMDQELDEAYNRYLTITKDGLAKTGTKMEKRKKKSKRINSLEEAEEDEALLLKTEQTLSHDAKTYAEMLSGPKDSDDSSDDDSDDDSDDGYEADPMTPEDFAATKRSLQAKQDPKNRNPLIHTIGDESSSAKTARWFSNPLFASIGQKAEAAAAGPGKEESGRGKRKAEPEISDSETEDESDDKSDEEDGSAKNEKKDNMKQKESALKGLDADEVLKSIPKTDKQKRHEKRLKDMAREERKKAKKAKKLGIAEAAFEIAPANDDDESEEEEDQKLAHMSETQKKKILEARELIKAGMGKTTDDGVTGKGGIEVVSEHETQRSLPIMDHRKYDSEHEDYDSDDYVETLALGTMTLRHSKMKAFVDASYNRYAWNDPEDLPEWFVDDETKYYRPKLPIPPALIAKIKERQQALSEKPIKKVAEARARKSKRVKLKLAAAKKKAEAVANNSDLSEAMKLKAISKALRQQDAKKPSKKYVVAKKGRSTGAKGVKLVDKRMKGDKRAMERAAKRKGGGSKKRRR